MKKVNPAVIILLGLVLVVLFFLFIYKPKPEEPFKETELTEQNIIFNNTSKKYYDTILLVGLQSMNLKNMRIYVHDLTEEQRKNFDGELKASVFHLSGDEFAIYINTKMSKRKTIEILAHELIHIKQYLERRIVVDLNTTKVIWEGKEVPDWKNIPYEERPWETEAYKGQGEIMSNIVETLY